MSCTCSYSWFYDWQSGTYCTVWLQCASKRMWGRPWISSPILFCIKFPWFTVGSELSKHSQPLGYSRGGIMQNSPWVTLESREGVMQITFCINPRVYITVYYKGLKNHGLGTWTDFFLKLYLFALIQIFINNQRLTMQSLWHTWCKWDVTMIKHTCIPCKGKKACYNIIVRQ